MCELSPLIGGTIIGLSVGFFTLLSLTFANNYKRKKEMFLIDNERNPPND